MIRPYDKQAWVGAEVITETGLILGWVKSLKVNRRDRSLSLRLVGVPFSWMPAVAVDAYDLPESEIICVGKGRLIVYEKAEERLRGFSTGILGQLGLVQPPWTRPEENRYILPTQRFWVKEKEEYTQEEQDQEYELVLAMQSRQSGTLIQCPSLVDA